MAAKDPHPKSAEEQSVVEPRASRPSKVLAAAKIEGPKKKQKVV